MNKGTKIYRLSEKELLDISGEEGSFDNFIVWFFTGLGKSSRMHADRCATHGYRFCQPV